jgi:2-(1,2-epoxy-1,2-dihydrophenyl)acetyl-CoA isomerase
MTRAAKKSGTETSTSETPITETQAVLESLESGVLTLTLNAPETLNALTSAMLTTLREAFERAARDSEIRVVVLTGTGRAFSAGQNLEEVRTRSFGSKEQLEWYYNPLILAMRSLEKPVICAVNGVAAGAGASIALAGDIRILSSEASLIEAFSKVGLAPDSGSTWFLPRHVGYNRAFLWMVQATRVTASMALEHGLCEFVYAPEVFNAEVQRLALELAAGPTRAFGLTKRALNHALGSSLNEALAFEAFAQGTASQTSDHREGVSAFLEKRPAHFTGK